MLVIPCSIGCRGLVVRAGVGSGRGSFRIVIAAALPVGDDIVITSLVITIAGIDAFSLDEIAKEFCPSFASPD